MRGATTLSSLGGAIRDHRRAAGLTQAQLANRASVNRVTVIKAEAGARTELATLFALTKALQLEVVLRPRQKPAVSLLDETEEL